MKGAGGCSAILDYYKNKSKCNGTSPNPFWGEKDKFGCETLITKIIKKIFSIFLCFKKGSL